MKLLIDNGVLFVDGLYLCYARSSDARRNQDDGCFKVEIRKDARGPYVHVDGIGRIGADAGECGLVLGRVLGRDSLIPCPTLVERLFALVENSTKPVVMEIHNNA